MGLQLNSLEVWHDTVGKADSDSFQCINLWKNSASAFFSKVINGKVIYQHFKDRKTVRNVTQQVVSGSYMSTESLYDTVLLFFDFPVGGRWRVKLINYIVL